MNSTNRRVFLTKSVALACGAFLPVSVLTPVATGKEPNPIQNDLFDRMVWMNEPASWKKSAGKLFVRSRPKTDFWRKTASSEYIADNGHFFHLPVKGDFIFEARINGQYAALYDQTGLMVRVDAENWAKCGTELIDGTRYAAVVFTREFSDGSTMNDLSPDQPVWWRVVRKGNSLETLCSLDGKIFTSVRQGYLVPDRPAEVGIMCASPEGNGFDSVFDNLKLT
ncbi:MAG TPA: DUF1349 domain-containing protein [Terriglobales bacterium]|nr:DUF1349 domain-containing protein [Terriglobales bacterium]